jgi:alanyl-tRNA synthetase
VETILTSFEEAKKLGAMALFEGKYGEKVRMIKIGNISLELCGGTHLKNTKDIGFLKIISESAVAAGIRRIEAMAGESLLDYFNRQNEILEKTAQILKIAPTEIPEKIPNLIEEIKKLEKQISKLNETAAFQKLEALWNKTKKIGEINFLYLDFEGLNIEIIRSVLDKSVNHFRTKIFCFISSLGKDGKIIIAAKCSDDLVKKGIHAGKIIENASKIIEGSGGGRADFAQGGGKNSKKLLEALETIENLLAI